jgi:beta-phosphoglucomutase
MAKAVVFDMDGTLVNNMNFHKDAWFAFLQRHGISISDDEFMQKNHGIITEIVPRFFPRKLSPEEVLELGLEKEMIYRTLYKPHIQPIEGLVDFLQELKKEGIKMALATAADQLNIDFTIDALGIRSFFSAITGSEEVTFGKPHPEVYSRTASKLGLPPSDWVAFEDSLSGIESALAAGMKVVALTTTHNREELDSYPLLKTIENYRQIRVREL